MDTGQDSMASDYDRATDQVYGGQNRAARSEGRDAPERERAWMSVYAPSMEIRSATAADVPALADLNAHVQALHVEAEPERYRPTQRAEVEARFSEIVTDAKTEVWLALVDGVAAGYLVGRVVRHPGHTYKPPHDYMLVDALAVAPTSRRVGVGRALMDRITDRARDEGVDRVELEVRAHNRGAIEFYEALGYAPLGMTMGRSV